MIKYYCDLCGKEMKDVDGMVRIERELRLCSNFTLKKKGFDEHICENCYDKIYNFVKDIKEGK